MVSIVHSSLLFDAGLKFLWKILEGNAYLK